jgi:hypothetical protein
MKVTGSVTKVETVDVIIDPVKVLEKLYTKWECGLEGLQQGYYDTVYINSKGIWEGWVNTHGSGITTQLRPATDEEKAVVEAFRLVRDVAR